MRRIDREQLRMLLSSSLQKLTIEVVDETGSTNADLIARLKTVSQPRLPIVRAAYRQTAGRGRHGRPWVASPGNALLFSFACEILRPPAELAGLSLAVSTAVMAGLHALMPTDMHRLALKWPNDILLDGAKLAGILIEIARSSHTSSMAVIGIGLNLDGEAALAAQLSAQANPPAVLARVLPQVAMTNVLAHLLNALAAMLERFSEHGLAPFLPAWNDSHAYAGKKVFVLEGNREILRGIAMGVDAYGRLLIDTGNGMQTLASGDVSLRAHIL
ncbi:biotin--[acetyl-CoA-carboxylase] ligase [Mycoavidus sp. B2-EB]|uniref:biotin--[acetyl-CoA-carboxylase] ligase n=1 Tax=Mycoavidus sp. B2-EB TaxID=2651972 RepID=UPI00162416B5|nr:biotin--[acetyl-CoA-carboxylase] ligase [Mycoavidus sp. B2-EB]BBO60468.1 biotin--[acetyl-CoA-carboxylase] ligase [Mycoavidus sp. B2-EB]